MPTPWQLAVVRAAIQADEPLQLAARLEQFAREQESIARATACESEAEFACGAALVAQAAADVLRGIFDFRHVYPGTGRHQGPQRMQEAERLVPGCHESEQ